MSERSKSNCAKCPVRDICSIEYDGNEEPSVPQLFAADYGMFQIKTLGIVVDVPIKSASQTQPWTISRHPLTGMLGPATELRTIEEISGLTSEEMTAKYEEHKAQSHVPELKVNHPGNSLLN